jgi:outer membrane biosynthesis protein TonB
MSPRFDNAWALQRPDPIASRLVGRCVLFAGALLLHASGFAQASAAESGSAAGGAIVILPKMTVVEQLLRDYPPFPKAEVVSPNFSDKSAPIDMLYPGQAYNEGVSEGNATVGVMLDAYGHPTDFLLIRYTKKYFGDALMREARRQEFKPRVVKGVAVPGRFNFGTRFTPTAVMQMTSFNAIEERNIEIEGGPRAIYEPHLESEIDGGGLVFTHSTVALIPDGFDAPKGKTVKAFVSFYVDELGHVRLPNVEGAVSTLLIPNAVKAVQHWEFEPPKLKGKPVLVFALWSVSFTPFNASIIQGSAAPKP